MADKSYKSESHGLEPYGERDYVKGNFKMYFEDSVDIREGDIITESLDQYRAEDVVRLTSIGEAGAHKEVAVSKVESKRVFDI